MKAINQDQCLFGYTRNKDTGKLVVKEDEAARLRKAFEEFAKEPVRIEVSSEIHH